MKKFTFLLSLIFLFNGEHLFAKNLVTKATVHTAKKETKKFRLTNRIPVNYRKIEGSDILHITITFATGTRDLPLQTKPQNSLLFATMPMAAKGYPKQKLFELTEKYGMLLNCSGGIEYSTCQLGTINDYWQEGLNLLAAVVTAPSLTDEDIALAKDRYMAGIKSEMSDPNSYANDVVNRVFYPDGHPYAGSYEDFLKHAPLADKVSLQKLHADALSADNLNIAVVGSLDERELTKALSKQFGTIKKSKESKRMTVSPPPFVAKNSYAFENRDIPTAYIRIKFNSVGITDDNSIAARFLTRILSEELGEEIRTRQSLSYAVHSYTIQMSTGIGVISASTSKPKETLQAIQKVIEKLKKSRYSKTELDNHKRIYTTTYYLTQEAHSSLASALAMSELWHQSTDPLYEMPLELERVSPRDIQNLAKKLLVNLRVGVVYNKEKFEQEWAESLIKYSSSQAKKPKSKSNKG